MKIIYIIFTIFFLASCSKKTLYLTPDAEGKIYNLKAKQPISSTTGFLSFSPGNSSNDQITTGNHGEFKINKLTYSYFWKRPSMQSIGYSPEIYINFKGYKPKTFNYLSFVSQGIPLSSPKPKMNLGIIYLEPEK